MKIDSRCICKKCFNDFIFPISSNTKYIECSKCKTKYDICDFSSLIPQINKELLALKKQFYAVYVYYRIEVEQDYKLSISDNYSSPEAFINDTIEAIKNDNDSDSSYFSIPRLDIVAYNFVQSTNNDNFILYADDINPNLHRFAKSYKIGASFKEAINMPHEKPFFEDTELKDTKLHVFSYLSYLTSLYNGFYNDFSRHNTLVFYPFLMEGK
ncbi:hypothetical protein [Sulfurimonas sp.]|uniref:hypothetical protein n=1 Tax=Sulfurimonas sp. TaxID=2022749 RepID=UPI002B45E785|nr:hypothetical protein [Sulfurimonas sp.]